MEEKKIKQASLGSATEPERKRLLALGVEERVRKKEEKEEEDKVNRCTATQMICLVGSRGKANGKRANAIPVCRLYRFTSKPSATSLIRLR